METVSWKVKGLFKADAQKCYEEIGEKGITPETLLEKARNSNTELHKCFEWDDSIAAEKFRLQQARQVIQLLVVTPKTEEIHPVRAFQISSAKNTYQPNIFFMENKDEHQKLLDRAIGELKAIHSRYHDLAELENVFKAIEEL